MLSSKGDAHANNRVPAECGGWSGGVTVMPEGWAVGATFTFQRDPVRVVAMKVRRRRMVGGLE